MFAFYRHNRTGTKIIIPWKGGQKQVLAFFESGRSDEQWTLGHTNEKSARVWCIELSKKIHKETGKLVPVFNEDIDPSQLIWPPKKTAI